MKKIAIIPARSGSKGLRDKNIIPINGKPLLTYSIEAALQTELLRKLLYLQILYTMQIYQNSMGRK